jgi:hypothetical protein
MRLCTGSICLRIENRAGSCERSNETSDSTTSWGFLTRWVTVSFSRRRLLHYIISLLQKRQLSHWKFHWLQTLLRASQPRRLVWNGIISYRNSRHLSWLVKWLSSFPYFIVGVWKVNETSCGLIYIPSQGHFWANIEFRSCWGNWSLWLIKYFPSYYVESLDGKWMLKK